MSNHVKHFRTQRHLTQRQLAELAGTSQQQIQRIETGQSTPKLVLANRIAAAVQAPVDSVFPYIAKELRTASKALANGDIPRDPVLDALAEAGLDADPRAWTLRMLLRGHAEPLFYRVPSATQRHLKELFRNPTEKPLGVQFCIFDTPAQRVAVNLGEIVYCQMLFDADFGEPEDAPTSNNIQVRFAGSATVHTFGGELNVADPDDPEGTGELDDVLFYLGLPSEAHEFVDFADEDGERVFLRVGDISVLEIPLDLFAPLEDDEAEEGLEPA